MSDESKALSIQTEKRTGPPAASVGKGIAIADLDTMWWMCNRVVESGLAPKDCGTPQNALVRAQCGMEAGLSFMQSIQFVSNINGRPCIWGPPLVGLILSSGQCETWYPRMEGAINADDYRGVVSSKRKGFAETLTFEFSVADAKRAGLMQRDTYKGYLADMLLNRAIARIARRLYADVIGGMSIAENIKDLDIIDTTAVEVQPAPTSLSALTERLEAKQSAMTERIEQPSCEPESEGPQTLDTAQDEHSPAPSDMRVLISRVTELKDYLMNEGRMSEAAWNKQRASVGAANKAIDAMTEDQLSKLEARLSELLPK